MFKTLFSKIIAIMLVILLVSTSITGAMLYFFLWNFLSRENENLLNKSGENIKRNIQDYLDKQNYLNQFYDPNDPYSRSLFWSLSDLLTGNLESTMEAYSINTNSVIWFVKTDGEILLWADTTGAMSKKEMDRIAIGPNKYALTDARQYKDIMSGQKQFVKEIGNFYGLFDESYWLTIERTFIYNGEIAGAVYLHTKMPQVNSAVNNVLRFFMFSVAVAIIISILLVYIFSLRLSKPLKQINNAAKLIANGQFDKRLDICSEDEIGELAKSFNNMAVELENLEEMRRGFIANISHELRTPMTSIHGFIEGILDGTVPPERQKEYLTIVRDETKRLNRLTTDLLDLARMESGEIKLNLINININELIRRCIIKLENQIVQKDIQIEANFEEEEAFVNADADSIERVIINLVYNAIKFVSQNGKITIGTAKYRNKVEVFVEDNGIGIDSNEIDFIWDRFYKTDKSRSEDKTSMGLGLSIVKNIINEHKQDIWVKSEVGKGTKFSFTLSRQTDIPKEV
jgi:signal transduction histidine kinase